MEEHFSYRDPDRGRHSTGSAVSRHDARHIDAELARLREQTARRAIDSAERILAAINLRSGLVRLLADEDLAAEVADIEDLARRGLTALRRATGDIEALEPEDHDVAAAFSRLAQGYAFTHSTEVSVQVDEGADHLSRRAGDTLLRVAREALSNVERHAEASRVTVSLRVSDHLAELRVRDDGLGVGHAGTLPVGVGLELARQAVEPLGGSIELADADPGTELVARIPLTPAGG